MIWVRRLFEGGVYLNFKQPTVTLLQKVEKKIMFFVLAVQIKRYSFKTSTCCACKRVRNQINSMLRIIVCAFQTSNLQCCTVIIFFCSIFEGCGVYSRAAFIRGNTVSKCRFLLYPGNTRASLVEPWCQCSR